MSWLSQTVRVIVGVLIILSVAGAPASPFFVSQWWLLFTLLVGANSYKAAQSVLLGGENNMCLSLKADD